jgi:hypothetical protein
VCTTTSRRPSFLPSLIPQNIKYTHKNIKQQTTLQAANDKVMPSSKNPMIPGGPSNEKKDKSSQTYNHRHHPKEHELYRPTLLHLKCRGALHLSSPEHKAVCKGLPNRLETIREYPPMKPRQALHAFQHQISLYNPHDDDREQVGFGGAGGGGGYGGDDDYNIKKHQQQNRKRSNIKSYKVSQQKQQEQEQQRLPHVVDEKWDEMRNTLQEQTSVDLSKLDKTESEMTMYGTSSVYFLVLKPYSEINAAIIKSVNEESKLQQQQGKEKEKKVGESSATIDDAATQNTQSIISSKKSFVYAINPVNELGVSKRKVSSLDDGIVCSSTTVKLGILEIHMASLGQMEQEDEKDSTAAATSTTAKATTSSNRNMTQSTMDHEKDDSKKSSLPIMDIPSLQDIQRFIHKVDKFGDKLLDQMYQNAKFIKNEMENDFVNRTWKASEKVVGSCEKNWIRMKKNLVDTINFFKDSSGRD